MIRDTAFEDSAGRRAALPNPPTERAAPATTPATPRRRIVRALNRGGGGQAAPRVEAPVRQASADVERPNRRRTVTPLATRSASRDRITRAAFEDSAGRRGAARGGGPASAARDIRETAFEDSRGSIGRQDNLASVVRTRPRGEGNGPRLRPGRFDGGGGRPAGAVDPPLKSDPVAAVNARGDRRGGGGPKAHDRDGGHGHGGHGYHKKHHYHRHPRRYYDHHNDFFFSFGFFWSNYYYPPPVVYETSYTTVYESYVIPETYYEPAPQYDEEGGTIYEEPGAYSEPGSVAPRVYTPTKTVVRTTTHFDSYWPYYYRPYYSWYGYRDYPYYWGRPYYRSHGWGYRPYWHHGYHRGRHHDYGFSGYYDYSRGHGSSLGLGFHFDF